MYLRVYFVFALFDDVCGFVLGKVVGGCLLCLLVLAFWGKGLLNVVFGDRAGMGWVGAGE